MNLERGTTAEETIKRYSELFSGEEITINGFNPDSPQDRNLALAILLRDKSPDQIFETVFDLFDIETTSDENSAEISNLRSAIMHYGESVLGIDWS